MGDGPPERVKEMHEAVHLVDPIVEVRVICRVRVVIGGLPRMARQTVGSMSGTWNVYEGEVEEEYGYNPAIDTGGRGEIRVRQHTFNIPRIYFDY